MPKSSGLFGRRRRSTDINLIAANVRRSAARRAWIAFWVTLLAGWLLAAVITAQFTGIGLAIGLGLAVALVTAVHVGVLVLVWPVLRIIWHWLPEITLGGLLSAAISGVGHFVHGAGAVAIVAAAVGVLFVWPPLRRWIVAVCWCQISRHRLRVCFREFLPTDRDGSLPLILWATPTPVGERVWVWLRSGLSLDEIEGRLPKLAVACWARSVQTAPGGRGTYAAYVRFDIKRRHSFDEPITSPLTGLLGDLLDRIPGRNRNTEPVTAGADLTALDLPQVTPDMVTIPDPRRDKTGPGNAANGRPVKATTRPSSPGQASTASGDTGEDVTDWI